jgi:putative ABC transport system permease protein
MRNVLGDVRFALRLLRRSPGFAATLFFLLVGGIGATTAMFSVVESLLLAPLPYDHPEELNILWSSSPAMREHAGCSIPDFVDWRARATSFSSMAAIEHESFALTAQGARPQAFPGVDVTGDFFTLFRVHALRGRLLGPDDDHVGGPRVVVMSAHLWHERFASDPALVGGSVSLNNEGYTVVGIAPEGFGFGGTGTDRVDLWAPMQVASSRYIEAHERREEGFLEVIARRQTGVTIPEAQAQLAVIARAIDARNPQIGAYRPVKVADLHDELVDDARGGVLVLFAAIGLVFLAVCANVANLLLTRGAARRGEMAIRAALGASRGRLMAQLITETVVLFVLAGAASVIVARVSLARLVDLLPLEGGAASLPIRVDVRALAACLVVSLVFGTIFGLVPAVFVSRVAPEEVLKESAARAGTSRAQRAVRGGLVVAQIALAFALLAGAGLASKAFTTLRATDPGFGVNDRIASYFTLSTARYPDDAAVRSFVRRLTAVVGAQPGVAAAGVDTILPFGGSSMSSTFDLEGRPPWPRGEEPEMERNVVTPGYFAAMGMPLLQGRDLAPTDRDGGRKVVIVSKTAADQLYPGESPLGRRMTFDGGTSFVEIVGVVGDVRRRGLSRGPIAESFEPLEQAQGSRTCWLVVDSPRAHELSRELPALVQQVDADQAASWGFELEHLVSESLGLQRSLTLLLGVFAAAALVLATLGVFGLVSYATGQRTREIGLRMALGSTPEGVVALVVRGGLSLIVGGLALGAVAALLVGRTLQGRLAGVQAFDLAVYATVPLILLGAGLLACLVPAWRAVRIPPAAALRYE